MQKQEWTGVFHHTNKVLELDNKNIKAIYRRCKAYIYLAKVI